MSDRILLPALKSRVGDWVYYVCSLTFQNVERLIKSPDEIHRSRKLSEWIQREAIEKHSGEISDYILGNDQRFLGAVIVGVYDGDPNWAPIEVNYNTPDIEATEDQRDEISGKVGVLSFSGEEKLFAIDGQHRVAGIKKALAESENRNELGLENICAIFVGHDESSEQGRLRTRRLFTTVNKKAKAVSTAATIALDEDNGFAIVTRRLVDEFGLFSDGEDLVSFSSNSALNKRDSRAFTSIVGLYELVKDLHNADGKRIFENSRPAEEDLDSHYYFCCDYFSNLFKMSGELKEVFIDRSSLPYDYRNEEFNNLLFRPVGQRAFARATQFLTEKGYDLVSSIGSILGANLDLLHEDWHHILWDPISKQMIPKNVKLAETLLLDMINEDVRDPKQFRKIKEIRAELLVS